MVARQHQHKALIIPSSQELSLHLYEQESKSTQQQVIFGCDINRRQVEFFLKTIYCIASSTSGFQITTLYAEDDISCSEIIIFFSVQIGSMVSFGRNLNKCGDFAKSCKFVLLSPGEEGASGDLSCVRPQSSSCVRQLKPKGSSVSPIPEKWVLYPCTGLFR